MALLGPILARDKNDSIKAIERVTKARKLGKEPTFEDLEVVKRNKGNSGNVGRDAKKAFEQKKE